MIARDRNDAKRDPQNIEKQQVKTVPSSEDAIDSIASELQLVIADEFKLQVKILMAAISDWVVKAV